MRRHNKQPKSDEDDRHDARDPLDARAEQLLADLDERDREPDVGEDHGVPDAFEAHLAGGLEGGDEGDAEEPEGEGPDEAVWGFGQEDVREFWGEFWLRTYIAKRRASCFIISAIPGFSAKTP